MRVLVDTNILLRSAQPNHPLCPQATHAVAKLIRQKCRNVRQQSKGSFNVTKFPQHLFRRQSKPIPVRRTRGHIPELGNVLRAKKHRIHGAWKQIVRDYKVQGVKVYDARLAAIMTVYRVENVLTFNAVDFERYTNIRAIHPSSLAV